MKSPLVWYGGKGNFLAHIIPMIPEHLCYCEAFGGGAAVMLAKPPSKVEIYNDLNRDVVEFFRIYQDEERFPRFWRKSTFTPYDEELYKLYRKTWREQEDSVERIYRWFYVIRMSFNGGFGKSGASFSHERNKARQLREYVDTFYKIVDRLRDVQLRNNDFEVIFDKFDRPHTFFYLDPPYYPDTRSKGKVYDNEMTVADHERLIARLKTIKGKVLLSGYRNDLYDTLKWSRKDVETTCYSAHRRPGMDLHKLDRVESLWYNYEIDTQLLLQENSNVE